MLQLDDIQLYDLSEAGSRLFSDPRRLARLARSRRVPSAEVDGVLGLPVAWVEAESGQSGADPQSLASYWLGRLAPPSAGARRPRRDLECLPKNEWLEAGEATRRLFATPAALKRLEDEGRLPALRIEGCVRYDALLVDLLARSDEDPARGPAIAARRAEVRAWARYEYARPKHPPAAVPQEAQGAPAPPAAPTTPAPGAFQIPSDLGLSQIEPLSPEVEAPAAPPPSRLIQAEGYESVDED